jgi:hypothetical protein
MTAEQHADMIQTIRLLRQAITWEGAPAAPCGKCPNKKCEFGCECQCHKDKAKWIQEIQLKAITASNRWL